MLSINQPSGFVKRKFMMGEGVKKMPMTNLSINQDRVQTIMARNCMNPYDLCSKAGISYQSYRRIMNHGGCKLATLGRIAAALGVDVTAIIHDTAATVAEAH